MSTAATRALSVAIVASIVVVLAIQVIHARSPRKAPVSSTSRRHPVPQRAPVAPTPANPPLGDAVDRLVQPFLDSEHLRGCVVVFGTRDRILLRRAYGVRAVLPAPEPMTQDTVFDLASLTKPIATASSILLLSERGRVDLDAPVADWIPSFAVPDKAAITVRMLLTHTSGLPAVSALSDYEQPASELLDRIGKLPLRFAPGSGYLYSDLGYVVLGAVIRRTAGVGLSEFAHAQLFEPLGMRETRFLPMNVASIAPTEPEGGRMLRGVVHDPRARRMGGVAGHAGLFSTADDLTRFARALLGGGARVWQPDTVASMWHPAGHPAHPRTLAWDIVPVWDAKAGRTRRTFAHGGFTGTYLWLDPEHGSFLVLLSSRLHPDGKGNVMELRAALRRYVVERTTEEIIAASGKARDDFERRRASVLLYE